MPNHIKNRLVINADSEQVKEILERIKNDEVGIGSIDFNKIIPMPPELKIESSGYSHKALEFYSQYSKFEKDSMLANKLIKEYNADDKMKLNSVPLGAARSLS